MRSLATLLLLLGATTALQSTSRVQKLVENLSQTQQSGGHNCQFAINRIKNPKVDYTKVVGSGVPFRDTEFDFAKDMIYWTDYPYNSLQSGYNTSYVFERARTRAPAATIFGNGPNPYGINQGALGDCYFLAACSATAEYTQRLKNSFITQTYPAEGIIVVRAMILGKPTPIYIDDYLPFYSWSQTTQYFAKTSADNGLWAPFLEKVWAKYNGNYEITEGGWQSEVIQFLTGAPTKSYFKGWNYNDAATAWSVVTQADNSKYIMMAGTPGVSDKNTVGNGLAASHAYSLIAAYIVKNADGTEKAKLFLMRNPWGTDGQYTGAWNDNDAIWSDTVNNYAKQVPFTKNVKDGLFFISLPDFFTYFDAFAVSFYADNYVHSTSQKLGDTDGFTKFEFTITTATDAYLGLDFYLPRAYPKGCKKTSTGDSYNTNGLLQIFKDGASFASITAYESDNYGFVQKTLQPGSYYALVKVNWHADDVKDYSFRIYSPLQITITQSAYTPEQAQTTVTNADFKTGLTIVSTQTATTSSWYAYKGTWVNSGYFFQMTQGTSLYDSITYKNTFTAKATSASIIAEAGTTCTKSGSSGSFSFLCYCQLKKGDAKKACNYLLVMENSQGLSYGWCGSTP